MKLLVAILAFVALCSGSAIPLVPGDNSHYVEGESRYIWMSDDNGVPLLVDLETPVDEEIITSNRNGADNEYWLHTRNNPTNGQQLFHENINSVRNSNYRGNRPTKVIVHGWMMKGKSHMNPAITSAFLAVADVNVIVVDWSRLARAIYTTSVRGVPDVGRHLGNFIQWLFNNFGGNVNQLHLVGFSLGAHVVGNAGRTLGGRVSRVTGLDPAGPLWSRNANALNRNSGTHVESIHTDGGLLGIMDPISHCDFYPNGGRNPQPGCLLSPCSHERAPDLFASTIRTNHLVGRRCTNLNQAQNTNCQGIEARMGNAILGKRCSGLFGLRTGRSWPF